MEIGKLTFESELLIAQFQNKTIEESVEFDLDNSTRKRKRSITKNQGKSIIFQKYNSLFLQSKML